MTIKEVKNTMLAEENVMLKSRVSKLEKQITSMDCRFVGAFAEFSGSHCPLNTPCDRCKYEREIEHYRQALDKLARLGNGPDYGNSIGNEIARSALNYNI